MAQTASGQWRRSPEVGTFVGSSSIVAPKTDSAVIEWLNELRGIRGERPVTDKELDFARTNRVAGLPAQLESNDQVANAVAFIDPAEQSAVGLLPAVRASNLDDFERRRRVGCVEVHRSGQHRRS